METAPPPDASLRLAFEEAFVALLVRFGAQEDGLRAQVSAALDESLCALDHGADGGASLSRLDVLRIRAGKFAAARLPAHVYRDAAQLAALRREIRGISSALLGPEAVRGSHF
jgi:hypothetical protein